MFDGTAVATALKSCGVTHVVWLPDSELGRWEAALAGDPGLQLIRVCREGEALAVAAGLLLGGQRPVVLLQCTGLFEAGDSLRNVVHDLGLPLFLVVGVRSWQAHRRGVGSDTCPVFAEAVVSAWRLPYRWLTESSDVEELADAYRQARQDRRAFAVLLPE